MLDDAIRSLRETHTDARSQAMADWAATKDRTRLKIITATYRGSTDAAYQRLAIEADAHQRNDPHVPTEMLSEAEDYLGNAVNTFILSGDRVRALDYLSKAVQGNPAWATHPIITDFAAMLMQTTPDKAAALLGASGTEDNLGQFSIARGARWWQEQEMARLNVNRRSIAIKLIVYAVVAGLVVAGLAWVLTQLWLPVAARAFSNDPQSANALRRLSLAGADGLVLIGVVGVVFGVIEIMVRGYLLNLAAHFAEGRGSWLYLMHRLIPFQAIYLVALALGLAGLIFLMTNTPGMSAGPNAFSAAMNTLTSQLYVFGVASAVAYVVLTTRLLMETYRYSVGSGCLTLFIGTVASGVVNGVVVWAVVNGVARVVG